MVPLPAFQPAVAEYSSRFSTALVRPDYVLFYVAISVEALV